MTRSRDVANTQTNSGGAVSPFLAGKNKIINGDFNINQRAFSSTTTNGAFGFDRWLWVYSGGTCTYSAQTFTPGTAPVVGYEATNFARIVTASQSAAGDRALLLQRIENVRTLAGQTATISFWAKASTGTPSVSVEIAQDFGSGGSPSSAVSTYVGKVAITTSWARYSVTIDIPSISGKTIGTTANSSMLEIYLWTSAGSTYNARTGSLGIQNVTIDFWGVQVEAGSVATPFQTASGSLGGELALCQRYYARFGGTIYNAIGIGAYVATTVCRIFIPMPVFMRTAPTLSNSTASDFGIFNGSGNDQASALSANSLDINSAALDFTVTARTAGNAGILNTRTNSTAFIAFSSEL